MGTDRQIAALSCDIVVEDHLKWSIINQPNVQDYLWMQPYQATKTNNEQHLVKNLPSHQNQFKTISLAR